MASNSPAFRSTLEIEVKFDLPDELSAAEISRRLSALLPHVPGVAKVGRAQVHRMEATYFDTADLVLLANRCTLRRRSGGADEGWHLKRPLPETAREEMHHPLGRSVLAVPAPLRAAVEVHLRGRQLAPIARLATTRTVRVLRDAGGDPLAEVMIDEVSAERLGAAASDGDPVSVWRELEVELTGGDIAFLSAVSEAVSRAGAVPSASASKLARAVGAPSGIDRHDQLGPAVDVVLGYLAAERAHLMDADPEVRVDAPDSVHQMRVAARRLRSCLATFRPLFDRSVTDPIRDELRWLGQELGAARDLEVVRDHLLELVAAEPRALRRGPVVRRIRASTASRYRQAHAEGLAQLGSPRYFALLDALDALVADPPLAPGAADAGTDELRRLTLRTWKRLSQLHQELDAAGPAERDVLLHEIRKAAKRARYAGEAMADAFREPAVRYAAAMSRIQSVLGAHQDSVVIRDELLALADAAAEAGENAFTYGRLHAAEQARGEQTDRAFAAAWEAAGKRSVRSWLS